MFNWVECRAVPLYALQFSTLGVVGLIHTYCQCSRHDRQN